MNDSTDGPCSVLEIVDLLGLTPRLLGEAAVLLYESFKTDWPEAWPTVDAAMDEVSECCAPDRIGRAAIDKASSSVLGWIGGISTYDGLVWELHPLCVSTAHRHLGIGRALVLDLELQVRAAGGLTIYLGTDDVSNQTSLSGVNLFENPWQKIEDIRNLSDHPFSFYQRLGFTIVGVVPDANGPGKPDIMMAKSVRQSTT